MKKYLNRLSRNERILLAIAAFLISGLILFRGLIGPCMAFQAQLEQQLTQKEARLIRYRELASLKLTSTDQIGQGSIKSDEQVMADFLKSIDGLAKQSNIKIQGVRPLPVETDELSKKYAMELQFSGDIEAIVKFLYEARGSSRSIVVQKLGIRTGGADSQSALNGQMTAVKIVLK
jgi:Tfp pilus assembly protein PilO